MIEQILGDSITVQLLVGFVFRFFFIFGIIGFALGLGLAINNVRMHQIFGLLNQWVSVQRSTKWLTTPHNSEAIEQRFHRLIGVFFILAAVYALYFLITKLDGSSLVTALKIKDTHALIAWLMNDVRWLLIAGNMLAVVFGIMLLFSPTVLRLIEARANHWYSARNAALDSEEMNMSFDSLVETHSRIWGLLIAAGSLILITNSGIQLYMRS